MPEVLVISACWSDADDPVALTSAIVANAEVGIPGTAVTRVIPRSDVTGRRRDAIVDLLGVDEPHATMLHAYGIAQEATELRPDVRAWRLQQRVADAMVELPEARKLRLSRPMALQLIDLSDADGVTRIWTDPTTDALVARGLAAGRRWKWWADHPTATAHPHHLRRIRRLIEDACAALAEQETPDA